MGVMNLLPCAEVIPIRRRLVAVIQLVCQIVSTELPLVLVAPLLRSHPERLIYTAITKKGAISRKAAAVRTDPLQLR
jgi:hypothetical protein